MAAVSADSSAARRESWVVAKEEGERGVGRGDILLWWKGSCCVYLCGIRLVAGLAWAVVVEVCRMGDCVWMRVERWIRWVMM